MKVDARGGAKLLDAPRRHAVEHVHRIPFYVEMAVRNAIYGRPGASYLDLPDDIITAKIDESRVEEPARCPDPPRVTLQEPEQTQLQRWTIKPENGPVPVAGIAFRAVPDGHPDAVALSLLMSILGGGESSRVYVDLVRRREIAVAGMGMFLGLEQAGFAALVGVTMPFGDTGGVLEALWEQVELVKAQGVTEEELAKARQQALAADVAELQTVASKANALGQAATLFGDAQEANERIRRMETVTAADLQRVAQAYLVRERANEIEIKPGLLSAARAMLSMGTKEGDQPEQPSAEAEILFAQDHARATQRRCCMESSTASITRTASSPSSALQAGPGRPERIASCCIL